MRQNINFGNKKSSGSKGKTFGVGRAEAPENEGGFPAEKQGDSKEPATMAEHKEPEKQDISFTPAGSEGASV